MDVCDETCVGVETPIGSRSNRKTLAAQKLSPEFSDISSDEEIWSDVCVFFILTISLDEYMLSNNLFIISYSGQTERLYEHLG